MLAAVQSVKDCAQGPGEEKGHIPAAAVEVENNSRMVKVSRSASHEARHDVGRGWGGAPDGRDYCPYLGISHWFCARVFMEYPDL